MALRALQSAAVFLAVVAVVAVISLERGSQSHSVVLSEDKALALAEGKISDAEKQSIAAGGMSPVTKMTLKKRDQLRKLVKDAEQKEAMVTLQAWKLQQAQDALHRQLTHRPDPKIRHMLDENDGRATDLNGGDALVSVKKIQREDAAVPAPITRRDAKGHHHFLSNVFAQTSQPFIVKKATPTRPQSREEQERVRAFLESNGDLGSARRIVAEHHVGDELVAGGDERIAAGRADSHARKAGVGAFFDVFGGSDSTAQRTRSTLKQNGVNLNAEPWQTKGGSLF